MKGMTSPQSQCDDLLEQIREDERINTMQRLRENAENIIENDDKSDA